MQSKAFVNAFVERFIQTIQQECLDHFVVVGEWHLNHLVREFLRYYHRFRPHQGLENLTPDQAMTPKRPETGVSGRMGPIVRDEWLGGLLKSYRRAA